MPRHGENIRKRKDGRWEGRYCIYEPQSDRRMVRSVYARTYEDVKEKLLSAKVSGELVPERNEVDTQLEFHIIAQEWLDIIEKTKKYATYIKYRSIYEKYIKNELGKMPLIKFYRFSLSDLFAYCNKEKIISETSKKSIICVLNQIFSYAESHYHTKHFHYSYQTQNNSYKPVKILNQTEQAKLLHCLYYEMDIYKVGILLCISTGLRLGEICSLKWDDVDLQGKVLHVNTTVQRIAVDGQKGRTCLLEGNPKSIFSKREIPLSESIITLLKPYYNSQARYVLNEDKPMEPRTYQNKFQKYLQMAGVERKNFHTLRHTFATNCINSGTDIKSLSEILGHSDVKITLNRYVHPTLEIKRQHMNSLSSVYGQIMGQQ